MDIGKLEKINTDEWIVLLRQDPEYAKECSQLNLWIRFTPKQWLELLLKSVRKWNELTAEDWFYLLISQPQFAVKCDKFGELNKRKKLLLREHPELRKCFR